MTQVDALHGHGEGESLQRNQGVIEKMKKHYLISLLSGMLSSYADSTAPEPKLTIDLMQKLRKVQSIYRKLEDENLKQSSLDDFYSRGSVLYTVDVKEVAAESRNITYITSAPTNREISGLKYAQHCRDAAHHPKLPKPTQSKAPVQTIWRCSKTVKYALL
ncbi:hypothetical protein DFS33DRAFT_1275765 [Desarmillaria ectypa]|nr:hypothetical protein DFS33DRAFT_1275765 [Desarmillaria ectypa]